MTTNRKHTSTRRAAIYARLSEDRRRDELGVRRQLADCRKLAADRGLELVDTYVDNDISASTGRVRPEFERLLADVNAGHVDVIVCWHPDRLYRRVRELERIIDVAEAKGTTFATVRAGDVDLATPTGRGFARVAGTLAQMEVEHKGDRARRKHRELAEQGRVSGGGQRPFGFTASRTKLIEREARLLREAADAVLAGGSLRSIVRGWNDRGIKTTAGKRWHPSALKRVLIAPRIAGLRVSEGERFDAVWPAIIDVPTWERVTTILTDPGRVRHRGTARRYLLAGGLVRCGRCGTTLVSRPKKGQRRYMCSADHGGCNKTFQLADPLEDYVADAVIAALSSRRVARHVRALTSNDREQRNAAEELAGLTDRRDGLAESFASGRMSVASFEAADRKLDERVRRLRAVVATVEEDRLLVDLPTSPADVRERWDQAPLELRRRIVAATLDHVCLRPGVRGRNYFDPERVEFVGWRA